ncbi:hypothetical protein EDB85DRAFT_2293981 [Lactarius pseudohatsudake]|nr:hypothetical protein EDB85DRAFT_2293981 [Lactarius pseudohatsudake]
MTCDEGRPCSDASSAKLATSAMTKIDQISRASTSTNYDAPTTCGRTQCPASKYTFRRYFYPTSTAAPLSWPGLQASQNSFVYPHETFGREFSSLSDFLETLDEQAFFTGGDALGGADVDMPGAVAQPPSGNDDGSVPEPSALSEQQTQPQVNDLLQRYVDLVPPVLPSASLAEKFLLTAADPAPGTRDERLKRGYARLSRWMDCNVSQESKQQILQPLSVLRPNSVQLRNQLRDMDLVFIEEAFERLMLDYDRVFSCMGIPACLWRRTGEIYKGNREFAELVGIDGYTLRDVGLRGLVIVTPLSTCSRTGWARIYELMAEESAVNYWRNTATSRFDSTQKAVFDVGAGAATPGSAGLDTAPSEEGVHHCCFSFTIRRRYLGHPLMIVGNFIGVDGHTSARTD